MKETNQSMSSSQKKRFDRKREIEKAKKKAKWIKIGSFAILGVISVGIISMAGYSIYRGITKVKPSSEYSALISEDGLLDDINVADYLDLVDYANITVPLSEVEYTDTAVDEDIATLLEDYVELSTESDALIADGDEVNIDYVGTVDGVEFDGGNTNGEGADLVIGSGDYVDSFEEQLIGHGIGDAVTVNVTFPEDYSSTDLAGKDAVFEVTVNGIYIVPEFTDAFVEENLSDVATTVADYRENIKNTKYDENLSTWIEEYLDENTTVSSYPSKYINHLKSIIKYEDQSGMEYMNSLYSSFGYDMNLTFEDYVQMSETDYDATLAEKAQTRAKSTFIYQAIYENENLSVSQEDYATYFNEATTGGYDAHVETQGTGYVMQQLIYYKVIDYVKEIITVTN